MRVSKTISNPGNSREEMINDDPFLSDAVFDALYPESVQALSKMHWTPLAVARKVAPFLAAGGAEKILDIGSGCGKFCIMAAHLTPKAYYFGIEQRKSLITNAKNVRDRLGLQNISFIHGNFTQLNFAHFDHFYFYNSFYENLFGTQKIDASIEYSEGLYNYYQKYLFKQLDLKPPGTRLATLCTWDEELIPYRYEIVNSDFDERLKFWVKV